MILDFSPEIKLEEKEARLYIYLKSLVYLASFSAGLFLFCLIFFPSQDLSFLFSAPNALQNNIIEPRDQFGVFPPEGLLPSGKKIYFNAELREEYSSVTIEMEMAQNTETASSGEVSLRKAYRATLYPEGTPIGFKEGSLLASGENSYIVSSNALRLISQALIEKLGFSKEAFRPVDAEDLKYNPMGQALPDSGVYPQSSLFQIEETYYILDSGKLRPFSSANAFLSQYFPDQAISKDSAFLSNYEISNDPVGFADGSLVSFGESVFILSQKGFFPVNNTVTFESKGFLWEDVIPIGNDEIALYEKQKLFNIQSPHPDGVIFADEKAGAYFMVEKGTKRKIPTKNILQSWLHKSSIPFSLEALDIYRSCRFRKETLTLKNAYACSTSVKDMENFPGNVYELQASFTSDMDLDVINVTFKKEASIANFKSSASYFLTSILAKYGIVQ